MSSAFDTDDYLFNLRKAAARVGLGGSTLRQKLYQGRGPKAIKLPGSNRWRFRKADLDAWIASGEQRSD